jgi:hypothetical protein
MLEADEAANAQAAAAGRQPTNHHNVYVVLLDPAVAKLRKVHAANPDRDPKRPCV